MHARPDSGGGGQALVRGLALAAALTMPSMYLVEKYAGVRAIPAYCVLVAAAAWAWESGRAVSLVHKLGERQARLGAFVSCALLIALFALIFPLANSGLFGSGSDADEALSQAARALLEGRYPYHEPTYLGNGITPMPGALLLAMPFVLIGNSAYQSLFWLAAGALTLWNWWRRDSARAWVFCLLVLMLSPTVLYQLVTGTDYAANALMVLLPAIGLVTAAARGSGLAATTALAVVFGLALSSRGNFAFVAPLVLSRLWQLPDRRTAAIAATTFVATALAVTLPFFLADPAAFSPLHTRHKLAGLNVVFPQADLILLSLAAMLSIVLARRRWNGDTSAFLRNCALVEGVLIIVPALLHAVADATTPARYTAFGTLFLPFALAVYADATARRARAEAVQAVYGPRKAAAMQPPVLHSATLVQPPLPR